MVSQGNSRVEDSRNSKLLWGWLPIEVPILFGLALLFFVLGRVHWQAKWEGFVYNEVLRFYVPAVFLLAVPYLWAGKLPNLKLGKQLQFRPQLILEVAFASLAVIYIRNYDPIRYVDDAGFILRYLDNFQKGCFFCFNPQEGPVFGLSSFIYGLLGGLMTWTGIYSPESAVSYLSYIGTFFTGFLYFLILRTLFKKDALVLVFWFLLMTCNRSMALIYNSGMESPIHFSIVLTAILFFLKKKDRLMWIFLALAAISKLDSVPMILVIMAFWTFENRASLLPLHPKNKKYQDALLFGLLPIVIWIVFAKLYFGSPMPQSAFAKVYFHPHAKGSWFPFLEPFYKSSYRAPFLYVSLTLWLAQLGFVAAKQQGIRDVMFGFAFIGTMSLYYFYNPGERMLWYYVLPEGLLLLQLCLSLNWFWKFLGDHLRLVMISVSVGFAFLFTWMFLIGERDYTRKFQGQVEEERIQIGQYLGAAVQEGDSLLSGHGLNSRWSKGLVIDQTGLNSKLATKLGRDYRVLLNALHPKWIVMHGHSWEVTKVGEHDYVLDSSFYDITTYGYPAWRIFKRAENGERGDYFSNLNKNDIIGDEIEFFYEPQFFTHLKAKAFTIKRPNYHPSERQLNFGLIKHEHPYEVIMKDRLENDSILWQGHYKIPKWNGPGTKRIASITAPLLREGISDTILPMARYITVEFKESYGAVAMYDPILSIKNPE